jgi:LPS export ABC transporter permease LptF/LPS export ABC transporter permease LptG
MVLKKFDRYIISEIFPPFFLGLILYTFVLLMNNILQLAELFITKGVPIKTVLKILILLLPSILSFTLPMAVLMGILAGLSRLSSDWEVMAFKSLGVSTLRFLKPLLIFSTIIFIVSLYISTFLAPNSNYELLKTLFTSVTTKTPADIKPRQFNEKIPNLVIYVNEIKKGLWENVFVQDNSNPEESKIIIAKKGRFLSNQENREAFIDFTEGVVYSFSTKNPKETRIGYFSRSTEKLDPEAIFPTFKFEKRIRERNIFELWKSTKEEKEIQKLIFIKNEFHKRLAFPFASIIFAILGLSLGTTTKKGGKVSGFSLSLLFIVAYYIIVTFGENISVKGALSPLLGIWSANIIFLILGIIMLFIYHREKTLKFSLKLKKNGTKREDKSLRKRERAKKLTFKFHFKFPNILDRYIVKKALLVFTIVIMSIYIISMIITFFELLDNAIENKRPVSSILRYLWFYTPQVLFWILPLSSFTTIIVTLGIMTRFNEVNAMKACGISVYRISLPLIIFALIISILSLYLQERVLPSYNRRAEEAKAYIKGAPSPRTYMKVDRRWVMGKENRIYNYRYFDVNKGIFDFISIYELSSNFSLEKRYFGERGYLEDGYLRIDSGWVMDADGKIKDLKDFRIQIEEDPSYFVKEWKEPEEMNIGELRDYIKSLKERGFETVKLEVEYHSKFSFPFTPLIMSLIAIPFSFSVSKKGTLYGVGFSLLIAIVYWVLFSIFKSLGNVQVLSPFLSAWISNFLFGLIGVYFLISVRT